MVDKMMNLAIAKRRSSFTTGRSLLLNDNTARQLGAGILGTVTEIEDTDDNLIWVKISNEEMIDRYGLDALSESENEQQEEEKLNGRCSRKQQPKKEIYTGDDVDEIDQVLFDRLQKEKNARANWRRLHMQIMIVKALSVRESEEMKNHHIAVEDEEEEEQVSLWGFQWMDRYVQKPDNIIMILLALLDLSFNIVYIFLVVYDSAFRLTTMKERSAFVLFIEFGLVAQMILVFFKAFPEKESPRGFICTLLWCCGLCKKRCKKKEDIIEVVGKVEENMYNTSFKDVAIRYLSGFFIIDFVSVVPFMIGKL